VRDLGEKMNIAVLGCGYWGSKHVRVLQALPEVGHVIAVDPRPDRLVALKRAFPAIETIERFDDAIDRIDAVVIATPPQTHSALGVKALCAGIGVLIEKPLATSTLEARRLIETAERFNAVLAVGHTFEYNAAVWKLRDLVDADELGRIHYLDSARLNLGLYQYDVNVVWDLAPHDISISNYVLRRTPSLVQAWGSRHAHATLEDVAYIRLMYENPDVTTHIHVSWLDPCKVRRTTVVGSSKMAVYNDLASEERVRVYDKGVVLPEDSSMAQMPMSYRYGDIHSPLLSFEEPLAVQDREFVRCVQNGERPATDGQCGLAVVQALEAADLSMQTGRTIQITEAFELEVEEQLPELTA
jgi:predicted dehydrogenase